jgi:hypothetical protein
MRCECVEWMSRNYGSLLGFRCFGGIVRLHTTRIALVSFVSILRRPRERSEILRERSEIAREKVREIERTTETEEEKRVHVYSDSCLKDTASNDGPTPIDGLPLKHVVGKMLVPRGPRSLRIVNIN